MKLDFKKVADTALQSIDGLMQAWLPSGKKNGDEWCSPNPTRNDKTPGSFNINLKCGVWKDFATGDGGSDLIGLYAYLNNINQVEALKEVASQLAISTSEYQKDDVTEIVSQPVKKSRSDWVPVLPAPNDAPEPPKAHFKRGLPEAVWTYYAADGGLLGFVYRFKTSDGGKVTLPVVYAEHPSGKKEWRWMGFPDKRPLYGLDRLAQYPDAAVMIFEGEKCADVGRDVFEGLPCITWPGGTQAIEKIDWSPLRGRRVIIWPDADSQREKQPPDVEEEQPYKSAIDQPGLKAAIGIDEILKALECRVEIVNIPEPGALPCGWDIADAVADGWDVDQCKAFARNLVTVDYWITPSTGDSSPAPFAGEGSDILSAADESSAEAAHQEGDGGVDKHFEYLLRNIALIAGKTRVFDKGRGIEMSVTSLRMVYGKAAVGKWLECDAKQVIEGADLVKKKRLIERDNQAADLTFQGVLSRYVLLDGTDSIFDVKLHQTISSSALKLAIGEAFPEWVNHPERRVIPPKNLVFDPTNRVNPDTHINLFRGLPLEPEYDATHKCLPIIDLIAHLVNYDAEAQDWLCKWLAYPLQMRASGGKMDTAVLMHGDEQGSGKSLFFELCYKPIFGDYAATLSQHQLDSQYTGWRSSKLFCLFEEVLSNNQKYSHTGTLKQMITGKTQQIERKFVDAWEEANYLNAVFLSNALQPFHLEAKDRRFLVIWPDSLLPEKEQRRIEEALASGGVEAFYGWLMSYDIDGFTPHTKPPITVAKQRLIDHGLATWEVFFRDWKEGGLGVPYGPVPTTYLFSVYSQWCEKGREGKPLSLHRFSTTIHAKMHKSLEHYRFGSGALSSPQRMFFYPKEGDETKREKKPDAMSKQDWFGLSAFKFKEAAGIAGWNTDGWDAVTRKEVSCEDC